MTSREILTATGLGTINNTKCMIQSGYIENVTPMKCPSAFIITAKGLPRYKSGSLRGVGSVMPPVHLGKTSGRTLKDAPAVRITSETKITLCPTGLPQTTYNPAEPFNRTGLAMWS